MEYLLFFTYLFLFGWLIIRIPFVTQLGISKKYFILLFIIKVAAGLLYGWFYSNIPENQTQSDTWRFFYEGIEEKKILFADPANYFSNLFSNNYDHGYNHFFGSVNSYWNDLKNNFMVKIVSVLNIFSLNNYYTNVIIFSFFTFFGSIAFTKVMIKIYPSKKKLILFGSFLLPSFLYWCSGIHKEGILFLALAFLIYHFFFALKQDGFTLKRLFWIAICIVPLLALRNYLLIALAPSLLAWYLMERVPRYKWILFFSTYLLSATLFFTSKYFIPKIDLPISVSMRQQEFLKLPGKSYIVTDTLEPTFNGFIKNMPQAFNHALLRPYPTESYNLFYFASSLEIIFYFILLLLWIYSIKRFRTIAPSILFGFGFSLIVLLIIGYIVPFMGAIVRYRSIVLPFLITPMLCTINWEKIKSIFKFKLANIRV